MEPFPDPQIYVVEHEGRPALRTEIKFDRDITFSKNELLCITFLLSPELAQVVARGLLDLVPPEEQLPPPDQT